MSPAVEQHLGRHARRVVVGGLCAAVILVGCSNGTDDTSTAATEAPSETPSDPEVTTSELEPLERYAGYSSEAYSDGSNWICRPDMDDVCDDGLDATVVEADGRLEERPWSADPDAPIDCFYVYPTISQDQTTVSDREAGEAERFVALNQVARLGETCRVFAPTYRQVTLVGLTSRLTGATTTTSAGDGRPGDGGDDPAVGPEDVLDAFRHYMANDNQGRGVVLIGHSQGASVLNDLIADEIDPNPDVRDKLVAAYLAGSTVAVPEGEDVGGDFQNVALCREPSQTGCVVTWATFRSTEPPAEDALFGSPRGRDGAAGCTNPADLTGGVAPARSYFPAVSGESILAELGTQGDAQPWVDPSMGEISTPFVTTPGLVTVRCVERDGASYLEATINGDPDDPRADDIGGDLTAQWGLHLQDVNLVMGDIVELTRQQGESWLAARG